MKSKYIAAVSLAAGALFASGCDDPQYVDPDTVALIVTNDSTGVERVNRCHYVPVLLGSEVKARYLVEDELRATITVTREDVSVIFEDAGEEVASFVVDSDTFASAAKEEAPDPPPNYTVTLRSPCTPDD
jgi:hypothetical protein